MSNDTNAYNLPDLKYKVSRIKTLNFIVNEQFVNNDPKTPVNIELSQALGISNEASVIDFRIKVQLFYKEDKNQILSEIVVQNIFHIEELNKYTHNGKLKIPVRLLINIIGLSISHGRALLSHNLSGTVYQDFVLTIVNPEHVAQHWYSEITDNEGKVKDEVEFELAAVSIKTLV